MDETSENGATGMASALLRALRPAIPAVIGAAALTFLFAALMPFAWVSAISWNLYLDRLSELFVPPVGNGGRLALAFGMAAVAALIAGFVALLIAEPEAAGLSSLRDPFRRKAEACDDDEPVFTRRRADLHPDDSLRPPLRAGRDLPAGGLDGFEASVPQAAAAPVQKDAADIAADDELILADLATEEDMGADAPWLQPAELTVPARASHPADKSLAAMVARFEAGLALRRQAGAGYKATVDADEGAPGTESPGTEPEVDVALEAALGTLQRMTRQSVG